MSALRLALTIALALPALAQADSFRFMDPGPLLELAAERIDPHEHNHGQDVDLWRDYLARPHPDLATTRGYFAAAAREFGVPQALLEAIGQVESNWAQLGPSIDRGWGIMHLVDNHYANTLVEAARLLGLEPQTLKDEAEENIRGAAALLADFGRESGAGESMASWFDAAARLSGLGDEALRGMQAHRYFSVLREGSRSPTLWGETLILPAHPQLTVPAQPSRRRSQDYPPAIEYLTPCNHQDGRNHVIDTWVNHWIGVGTYAGAISWFHNCDAMVSAHFVIRCVDGEITQIVRTADTAWHCGAYGYPYNNSRSIGVEHEATLSNPENWQSEPMLQASTLMANYFCGIHDIPMMRALPGIQGHNDMPGTATQCPGNLPWDYWLEHLNSPAGSDVVPEVAALTVAVFPNPFNPRCDIRFTVPAGEVSLEIFDPAGRRLRGLLHGEDLGAGDHTRTWDGRDEGGRKLPSGVYLARVMAGKESASARLLLLR